ncbi:MAG: hypothetical protein K9G48_09310 [Reyranella sp.]|nr:hypothetical protein [Reyranella sp.]
MKTLLAPLAPLALLTLLVLSPAAAIAADPPAPLPAIATLVVPPGPTGATVSGRVTPPQRDLYYVEGTYGQTMTVSVAAAGNSAVFEVYHPDTTVARGANGLPVISGRTLADAGAADNASAWIGALPGRGLYLIAVASRGGAASYTLTVILQ